MDPLVWTILEAILAEYLCPIGAVLAVLGFMVWVAVDWLRNPRDSRRR